MVTTENTRRAVQLLQTIVSLDRAITSDTAAEGRELVELARLELERVDVILDAGAGPVGEIRHSYQFSPGEVRVKYGTGAGGKTTVDVSVDRPREVGESWADATKAAVDLAADARNLAVAAIEQPPMALSIVDGGRA